MSKDFFAAVDCHDEFVTQFAGLSESIKMSEVSHVENAFNETSDWGLESQFVCLLVLGEFTQEFTGCQISTLFLRFRFLYVL